LKFQGLFIFI